ncbi:stabilizer of axonemal microtubules 4 [Neopsephotus bourkii]|uniref:stabilizer of axonemal microtubules 4 n=1 Tax=Neopsephotus bourkii TaxID=309878 RepID=UPI002AA596FE|nr:stabilizer of axonemal microtubules 4 [Neopsephotus bourkii]
MEGACPFDCHCTKLLSLGLDTVSPSEKALTGGSSDLMDFYATNYTMAHGQPGFCPQLGHHTGTGYVTHNHSAISSLLRPHSVAEGHCQDAMATTAEHFKPLWLPDGRSILPRRIHQPQSGYLQECPPSCLCMGMVSPQHMRLQQSRPGLSDRRCTSPLQPDTLQIITLGTKEPSGFTKATKRTNSFLPPLPIRQGQPVSVSLTTRDYLPSMHSHGNEMLPTVPPGSKRGSGFTQQGPSSLGTMVLPTLGHSASLLSRRVEATRETPKESPQRGGFQLYHPIHDIPARDATWIPRPIGGIQPQHPSGFHTSNHPTRLGDVIDHFLV